MEAEKMEYIMDPKCFLDIKLEEHYPEVVDWSFTDMISKDIDSTIVEEVSENDFDDLMDFCQSKLNTSGIMELDEKEANELIQFNNAKVKEMRAKSPGCQNYLRLKDMTRAELEFECQAIIKRYMEPGKPLNLSMDYQSLKAMTNDELTTECQKIVVCKKKL